MSWVRDEDTPDIYEERPPSEDAQPQANSSAGISAFLLSLDIQPATSQAVPMDVDLPT